MSILKNQKKVQREINIDTFWLWKISYYKCRCIRKSYESVITTNQQLKIKMIDHMLHTKANTHEQWYDIHDREMLAIVKMLEWWRAYLQEVKY